MEEFSNGLRNIIRSAIESRESEYIELVGAETEVEWIASRVATWFAEVLADNIGEAKFAAEKLEDCLETMELDPCSEIFSWCSLLEDSLQALSTRTSVRVDEEH
ncbi:MAG: hypothetical protein AAGI88_13785 [Pseudomonadota bacterium]